MLYFRINESRYSNAILVPSHPPEESETRIVEVGCRHIYPAGMSSSTDYMETEGKLSDKAE